MVGFPQSNVIGDNGEAKPPARPTPGEERTDAQGPPRFALGGRVEVNGGPVRTLLAMGAMGGMGGGVNLFPDGVYFAGTYANYRLMRNHPILALFEAVVTGPVESNVWTYKKRREDAPDAWLDFVEEQFEYLRPSIVCEALEAVTMAWQPFEICWERDGRYLAIDHLKPLTQEPTQIVADKKGRFAGLTQGSLQNAMDANKACIVNHRGRGGNLYGNSRLENVRETAWADWLHTMLKKRALKEKLSSIIPIFYVPVGSPPGDTSGKTYRQYAAEAGDTIHLAKYIVVEHLGLSEDDIRNNPDLLKQSLNSVDFYDAGNVATAQGGMIEDLQHAEMLMAAGFLRSARTALESQNGSRADAQQHTDTGLNDSAAIDREIAYQLNRGPVNALLTVNFGPAARDAIYIEPAPLVDRKRDLFAKVLDKLMAQAALAEEVAVTADVNQILDYMEVPRKGDFSPVLAPPPDPNAPPAGPNSNQGQ